MTTFNQAMLARDRTLSIRIGQYTSQDIKSADFYRGFNSGDTLKFGGTVAGGGKVVFSKVINSFSKLDKIQPEIGLLVDNQYVWTQIGEYFINDIKIDRNRNTTEISLMDGMFKLNQQYVSDLTYPAQVRDVIREIAAKTGITLATDNLGLKAIQYHVEAKSNKKDITFRQVLSQVIQLLGFSAFFNRNGQLEIKSLTESNITITADSYFLHGFEKSEIKYQIAGITCKKDKKSLSVGLRTGRSLEIENEFMSQHMLDNLYSELKDVKYYPFSLNYQGHLGLEVGQWVTIVTNKQENYRVPILTMSINFNGGLSSKISADIKASNDAQYAYKGFLGKKIEQLSTDLAAEVQQQIEYVNSEFNKKFEANEQSIADGIEVAKAKSEQFKSELESKINAEIKPLASEAKQEASRANQSVANQAQEMERLRTTLADNKREANQAVTNAFNRAEQLLNQSQSTLSGEIAAVSQSLSETKRNLLEQANAQTELSSRVTTVEETANGTRTTVTELQKTVNATTGNLDAVSRRTKTVEDNLSGLTTRFENIRVGGSNLLRNSRGPFKPQNNRIDNNNVYLNENVSVFLEQDVEYTIKANSNVRFSANHNPSVENDTCVLWLVSYESGNEGSTIISDENTGTKGTTFTWRRKTGTYYLRVNGYKVDNSTFAEKVIITKGNVSVDWSPSDEDYRSELATYKNTVDSQLSELSSTINTNNSAFTTFKNSYERTAQSVTEKLTAFEAYKNNEHLRSNAYLEASKTETAKQLQTLRTAISEDYVAKSRYEADATGIRERFEGLSVGGRNYFTGTRDFSGVWYNNRNWQTENKEGGFVVKSRSDSWVGITQSINSEAEEWWTYSADVKGEGTNSVRFYPLFGTGSASTNLAMKQISIDSSWQRISVTFKVTTAGIIRPRIEKTDTVGKVYIKKIKLEKGKIATPWEQAPEDTETRLATFERGLQGIEGKFTTLNNEVMKTNSFTINENGIVLQSGRTVNGKTFATMIAQNAENVSIIARLMRVNADMIVNGAITGRHVKANSIGTGHMVAGSVTATVLAANAVTADKLLVNHAMIHRLTVGNLLARKIIASELFVTAVQAVDISAARVTSGILASRNGAISWDLDRSNLILNKTAKIQFNSFYNKLVIENKGNFNGSPTSGGIAVTKTKNTENVAVIFGTSSGSTFDINDVSFTGLRIHQTDYHCGLYGSTIDISDTFDSDGHTAWTNAIYISKDRESITISSRNFSQLSENSRCTLKITPDGITVHKNGQSRTLI